MSLLVALVSVTGIVAPILVDLVSAPDHSFGVLAQSEDGRLDILVRNNSQLSGYILSLSLQSQNGPSIPLVADPTEIEGSGIFGMSIEPQEDERKNLERATDCQLMVVYVVGSLDVRSAYSNVDCSLD